MFSINMKRTKLKEVFWILNTFSFIFLAKPYTDIEIILSLIATLFYKLFGEQPCFTVFFHEHQMKAMHTMNAQHWSEIRLYGIVKVDMLLSKRCQNQMKMPVALVNKVTYLQGWFSSPQPVSVAKALSIFLLCHLYHADVGLMVTGWLLHFQPSYLHSK